MDILHPNGEVVELTTKEDIETACMTENEKKYKQTKNTPCMISPLRDLLGYDGNTQFGREILQGTFTASEGTPLHTLELFDQLKNANLTTKKPKAMVTCAEDGKR